MKNFLDTHLLLRPSQQVYNFCYHHLPQAHKKIPAYSPIAKAFTRNYCMGCLRDRDYASYFYIIALNY